MPPSNGDETSKNSGDSIKEIRNQRVVDGIHPVSSIIAAIYPADKKILNPYRFFGKKNSVRMNTARYKCPLLHHIGNKECGAGVIHDILSHRASAFYLLLLSPLPAENHHS